MNKLAAFALTAVLLAGCTPTSPSPQQPQGGAGGAGPVTATTTKPSATASTPPTSRLPGGPIVAAVSASRGLPLDMSAERSSKDPQRVAFAFVAARRSWDTAVDRSEFEAQFRAATVATPAFATKLTTNPPGSVPGPAFMEARNHNGFQRYEISRLTTETLQNSDTMKHYMFAATWTPAGDGWTGTVTRETWFVTVVKDSDGSWLVFDAGASR